ncbi:alkyl sulfatase dimerization domain-containing protein [Haloglomus halophilum]|uniref:alkyl sulfatase dimerization domain-containing protein n=1 Tax=Haloglomus halophilum TaxID=2962672 RepID=UPI0020C93BC8|nr:alkyl sulfatase dimerization domain-containing protein [Haloglomus halophilum]
MVENAIETVAAVEAGARAPEIVQVTDRTYFCPLFSGVTAFETDDGLVLVDTGLQQLAPHIADALREHTDAPVDTAIYTHGHVDHAYGLEPYLLDGQADPEVVAHEAVTERFARYGRTRAHNEAINARQFGGTVDLADMMYEDGSPFGYPDYQPTTEYRDELVLTVGGERFELHHGRGETDDHTWVYCPGREVLCSGDFSIGACPNAGNPQKVQRYPGEWVDALREMAAEEPRHLCPGHGDAIVDDPDAVDERLVRTAAYLEDLVDETLAALNDESPPHVDIVHDVDYPDADAEWLAPQYDEPEFIVRSVIRRYGGWWTGRPSELKPAPRAALASEVTALAGGPAELAERAEALADDGEYRLAGHLADFALEAAPEDDAVAAAVNRVYSARADQASSLMAGNIYRSAASYAGERRPFR